MNPNNKTLKICISTSEETLNSEIDPRFGRCKYFILIEIKEGEQLDIKSIKNIGATQGSGAGISAAEQISKLGVNVLITGDVGPKASNILNQLGIKVVKASGIAREAVSEYMENNEIKVEENISNPKKETVGIVTTNSDQRIFIPLMDNSGEYSKISLHFGHAPFFGLYDLASKKLIIKENKLNHGDPNRSPVDQIIESVNPTVVFAQDMGARAVNLFTEKKIELKTGQYKTAKEVIDNIDKLEKLTKGCEH